MMVERQLSLFKGKRQKGTKPKPALEFKTHVAVADTLTLGCAPGWLWTHFPAGELRDKVTASRLKRMGLKAGWPDFLLVDPEGHFHCLELKRGNNPLTEAQSAFRDEMGRRGVPYVVARSYDAAIDQLRDWGALRLRIAA
ncbi:VRR-NUC domain-containing protein [Mesorhizobium sp. M1409]|uniref:VRR-NUC domain-containing protein n=1 Tax=Mesorhizobium sp. M1409 TaxID=2957100 RepID=UPI00333DD694